MASKIQFKRSSVAGKQPNTTNLSVGELAFNMADGKLYSSNGSDIFEPAGNVSSLYIGNSSSYSTVNSTFFSETANNADNLDGIAANQYAYVNSVINATSNFTITGVYTFSSNVIVNGLIIANGGYGTAGQVLTSNGINGSPYWTTVTGSGGTGGTGDAGAAYTNAVSYVDTVILAVNGAITGNASATYTAAYDASVAHTDLVVGYVNTSITANAGAAYSNAVGYIDSKVLSVNSAITDNAYVTYTNATNFSSNASNISSGTLAYARLPSNLVNTTSSFTFSNTLTFNGNIAVNNSLIDSTGNSGSFGQYLTSNSNKPKWISSYYYTNTMYDYTSYGLGWSNIAPNQNASTLGFRTDVPIPYGAIWIYISNDGSIDSHPITVDSPNNIQTPMMWLTTDGSGAYDAATNPDGKDYWFNITPPPSGA